MVFHKSPRGRAEEYAERILRRHGVSPEFGFLGEHDPLVEIPEKKRGAFQAHLTLGKEMPDLVFLGGNVYHRRVLELPMISPAAVRLLSHETLLRLAVTISFLVQAYVWQNRRLPRKVLPVQLAAPMYVVARTLDVAPLLIYQFYTLANWERIASGRPIAVENVRMIQNFNSASVPLRRSSEEWFVAIHIEIERRAGEALKHAFMVDHALQSGNREVIGASLGQIERTLKTMTAVLLRMNEGCDPDIYYEYVRPYLFGWFNVEGGVIYEGVPELFGGGQLWRGQTGAQSSIAPLLDTLLSILHDDPKLSEHLRIMLRHHTPKNHRRLIAALSPREIRKERWAKLLQTDDEISERYRKVRRAFADFRRQHYDHALLYIAKPARREHEAMRLSGEAVIPGTGGSDLIRSLKLHIAETLYPDERESGMKEYEEHWKELYHSS